MDETIVKYQDGMRCIYKPKCGCSHRPVEEKPKEETSSLPPMLLVDNCSCTWTLSIININGIDYWAVDGVILVDRNWDPIPVSKLELDTNR